MDGKDKKIHMKHRKENTFAKLTPQGSHESELHHSINFQAITAQLKC